MLQVKLAPTLLLLLDGLQVFEIGSSSMFCEGKLLDSGFFAVRDDVLNGSKMLEGRYEKDVDTEKQVHPPPFPPPLIEDTGGVVIADRGGGQRAVAEKSKSSVPLTTLSKLVPSLILWYGTNVAYGWLTKKVLVAAYYPWTIATFQALSGLLYQLPLWYLNLRKLPRLSRKDIKALIPAAVCQFFVHAGATIATGIEHGLPIAHAIKALEPVVTLGIDSYLFHRVIRLEVFLGIIPLVVGTVLPYWQSLHFNLSAFVAALVVVVSSSIRVILCHKILNEKKIGKNLDPENLFSVLSIMSSVLLIPITLQSDGFGFFDALKEKMETGASTNAVIAATLFLSGFLYYTFNEASFGLMEKVTPGTHAVANQMRRPVVILGFCFVHAFYQLCRKVSLKLVPFSFLFWSQSFRESHSLGDAFHGSLRSTVALVSRPSIDSLVGSAMALMGCMIYLEEMNMIMEEEESDDPNIPSTNKKATFREKKHHHKLAMAQ